MTPTMKRVASTAILSVAVAGSASISTALAETPDQAILVVDTSGSMTRARLDEARSAVTRLASAFPDSVPVGLVTVKTRPRLQHSPDLDRPGLLEDIDGISGSGDTSLFDSLVFASSLASPTGGGTVIVMTDGADTNSQASVTEVIEAAQTANVAVDVVAISPTEGDLRTLRRIANQTGGVLVTGDDAVQLADDVVVEAAISPEPVPASSASIAPIVPTAPAQAPTPVAAGIVPAQSTAQSTAQPSAAAPLLLAALIALIVLVCAALIMWSWISGRRRERLADVGWYRSRQPAPEVANSQATPPSGVLDDLNRRLAKTMDTSGIKDQLSCAGVNITPAAWLIGRFLLALLAALSVGILAGLPVVGILVCAPLGWFLPLLWIKWRISRRRRMFADQLPDFLVLLASTLRAGLSLAHGIDSVASQGDGEVERQMRWVLRQVQIGSDLDDALIDCADRMASDDLRWVVLALGIQREVGGNLSAILETAARTIKARQSLRAEVRTLSAEGRLSAYVLIALPLGVLAFLMVLRPEYISALWSNALGWTLLIGMSVALVLGWFWIRSIVRVKA